MMRPWLAVALALYGCKKSDPGEGDDKAAPAEVTCAAVAPAMVAETVDVTGVIAPPPKLDAVVSSPIAGRVGQVAVEEGDHVAAGALLATIEDPALPAGSIEAQAGVAAAQAAKAQAELDVARQQRLVDAGIGARKDLEDARARAAAAAAELDAAMARAGLASKQLARRELRAPRAGVVLHLYKRVGESVDGTTGTPIAEVADVSVLELRAQVSTAGLAKLSDGLAATVEVLGIATRFAGTVARVAPAVDPATLLGTVRIAIANKPDGIKVGSAARAQIVIAQHPGVIVPEAALRRSIAGADEVVVCDTGKAKIVEVTIGQRTEHGVALAAGLTAGQQIVVDHVLGLEDGQPLVASKGSAK